MHLPGSLQAQGLGRDVDLDTPWTGQIKGKDWHRDPRYAPHQDGAVKFPFWLQPLKHYVGAARYERRVEIPSSLDEAAEIDGATKWQLYWDVILPLARPGLVTLSIFTFIGNYQSFFWPLVMIKSTDKYTLPIGLLFFDSSQGQQTNLLMAGITLSVLPMVIIFVVLQKQLVKGIQLGAVKG